MIQVQKKDTFLVLLQQEVDDCFVLLFSVQIELNGGIDGLKQMLCYGDAR